MKELQGLYFISEDHIGVILSHLDENYFLIQTYDLLAPLGTVYSKEIKHINQMLGWDLFDDVELFQRRWNAKVRKE